jgi:hypothetical protein
MKIRWREHELILVVIITMIQIGLLVVEKLQLSNAIHQGDYTLAGWRNYYLPQIASILLVFSGYLLINFLIIPQLRKITFHDFEKLTTKAVGLAFLSILISGFLLALGSNVISYFARPHLVSYGGYRTLALFGYNDQPLSNLFFGVERGIGLVLLFMVLFGLREIIIGLLDRVHPKREFRILVTNNATALTIFYFIALLVIAPAPNPKYFISLVTPLIVLYLYLTFWFFPSIAEKSLSRQAILLRLFLISAAFTLPAVVIVPNPGESGIPWLYWIFLMFVAMPLTWLLYQQRKDQIAQLKGIEAALAQSSANLQLLRTQINPHFLFNALNTLYGTALKGDTDSTAEGIQKLGDMMRFMLHENTLDFIPMHKEQEYLRNFIDLQKLRTQVSPDIRIEDNIEEVLCVNQIAPMLLIPFIENAFKHGISLNEKSWIKINLSCQASLLTFEVKNSIHQKERTLEKGKSGIGLVNVKERLKLQYPDRHLLAIDQTADEFTVKLILQC